MSETKYRIKETQWNSGGASFEIQWYNDWWIFGGKWVSMDDDGDRDYDYTFSKLEDAQKSLMGLRCNPIKTIKYHEE